VAGIKKNAAEKSSDYSPHNFAAPTPLQATIIIWKCSTPGLSNDKNSLFLCHFQTTKKAISGCQKVGLIGY